MICRSCNSYNLNKRGFRNGLQRHRCMDCGTWSQDKPLETAKVLLFDIETTPMEVYVWSLFGNKYINHGSVIEDWNVLSWSAKWLFDSKIISDVQTPKEARARDDKRIMHSLWKLIDKADVIIAHNGDKFDIKKINTRFHLNGLLPPSPYQSIDTLKVVKRSFAFSSNRLDYLGHLLKNKGKISTNFKLWTDCLHGDKDALNKMLEYNEEDVRLLEEVYVELRPWIKSHPNMGVHEGYGCPVCGSDELRPNGGYYTTMVNKYLSYRCGDCGSLSRRLQSELSVDERAELMRSLPK